MTNATVSAIETFITKCDNTDWHYTNTDCTRTYYAGKKAVADMRIIVANDELLAKVFKEYAQFMNGRREKPTADEFITVEPGVKSADVININRKAANDDHYTPEPEPTSIELTREVVADLVADGKFFNVEFIKRTTGELRTMQARMNVTKHLKGGSKKYEDKIKNLLTVFSMDANGYRSVPIDTIQAMTVKGVRYIAAQSQQAVAA